jgi:hypothetical protein
VPQLYRLEVAFDHKFTDIAHTIDTPATRFIDTTAWPAASYWWRVKVIAPIRRLLLQRPQLHQALDGS